MEFTGVAASDVASQVGAFASNNKAAAANSAKAPRPALAPADPEVLARIKGWAIAALGGEPLQLPDNLKSQLSPSLANSAPVEIYVRQMACRKPDCVPLETIMVLLGHGWHEKVELLVASADLKEEEVSEAAKGLWQLALKKAEANKEKESQVASSEVNNQESLTPEQQLAKVQQDLFVKKEVGSIEAATASSSSLTGVPNEQASSDGASMDLPVVLPRDINDFAFSEDEVYVVGTNGRKITVIAGLEHLAATLKELVLRSHVISRMEGISTLIHLTKLELYDNQIESLEQLENLKQLTVLDMSYNSIRSMKPVLNCPLLQELYLAQNKLRTIEGVEGLLHLRKLDIGGNRIRSLDSIHHCKSLEELWAGKNKIETLLTESASASDNAMVDDDSQEVGKCATDINTASRSVLFGLDRLRRLDIQSNRFVCLDGIEAVSSSVEELYLARNGLVTLNLSLTSFSQLNTLDLSSNRLKNLHGLSQCCQLEEVWASGNNIETLQDVQELTQLNQLNCVYLEHNPLQSNLGAEYRSQISSLIKSLTQIDATSL